MSWAIPRVTLNFLADLTTKVRASLVVRKSIRCASASAVRGPEKMDELVRNPFYNKYSSKLTQLQQADPESFLKKIEQTKVKKTKQEETVTTSPLSTKQPSSITSHPVYNKKRQLKDIMKTELLHGRSPQEISEIWTGYHKSKEGFLAAVAPSQMYETIMQRAQHFPVFLYPLPRSGGYEFFVAEFHGSECYFTQLINYQTRKQDAPPCLCVIHFEDFKEEGLVLMRGEYDHAILNPLEVQCLLNQMQLYYGTEDKEKIRLMESFHRNPDGFRHMDLISEVEHSFTALK